MYYVGRTERQTCGLALSSMSSENFREAKLIEVIETRVLEGHGTKEDMYRVVIYYTDPESGKLLAMYDIGKEKEAG